MGARRAAEEAWRCAERADAVGVRRWQRAAGLQAEADLVPRLREELAKADADAAELRAAVAERTMWPWN